MSQEHDSIAASVIGRESSQRLLINSSFLSRDLRSTVKTQQSSRRLTAQLTTVGKQISAGVVDVIDGRSITAHYKILPLEDKNVFVTLEEAVAQELARTGNLLFVLAGTFIGLRPGGEHVESKVARELRLDSSLKTDFANLGEGVYGIRTLLPIEDLLALISGSLPQTTELSNADRRSISDAYNRLLDAATMDVGIPAGRIARSSDTVLGQIVAALQSQKDEYALALTALRKTPDDRRALHEVLRIAYNFATDVLPLMSLFMSICDLKPLMFWCTIDSQWSLYSAFAALPWAALGKKESLHAYRDIVSQARNYAFHHVLPFDATVEINLLDQNVRAEKIRLFVPFGEKQGRGIRVQDQELANVLAEFSRARQRPVSIAFWQANLKVMQAACRLAQQMLEALILIREATLQTK